MSFNRFVLPYTFTVNNAGTPYENAYLIFYETDMVTQQTTYSDYLCTVPSATVTITYESTLVQAIQANASGVFPTIFMPSADTYYWVLLDENFNTLKNENQYSVPPTSTLNPSQFVVFDGNTYIARPSIEIVGTTYTVDTATSWGNIITFNNPNPVTVMLAAPSLSAFPAGWIASFQNIGNGTVIINGGANINGFATLILNKSDGADISSDGTLFNAQTGAAELLYLSKGALLNVTTNAVTITSSAHLINTASAAQIINTINGGSDSQELLLQISSASNSLTINSGSNIKLANGAPAILTTLDHNILLKYDLANNWWAEISRNASSSPLGLLQSTSPEIVISSGNQVYTFAHGLGRIPTLKSAVLRCKVASMNFNIGDEIDAWDVWYTGAAFTNLQVSADVTNVYVNQATAIDILDKTTSNSTAITYADFVLVIRVWA